MFTERIDGKIRQWLEWWHGRPDEEARQYQYYRCLGCHHVVTWKTIKTGGCECGMSNRIAAAKLTRLEKARIVLAPWSI